jgi:para-nitrobenzyl esterase
VWAALYSDREMVVPAVAALDAHAAAGGRTFAYRFDWTSAPPRADGLALRSFHGVDIPFTFATFAVDGWDAFVGADTDPRGAHALSTALRASWCGFARTGDPAHDGVGPWPAYTSIERPMMRLAREPAIERDPVAARLSALAAAGITP